MPADINDYFKKNSNNGGGNNQNMPQFEPPDFIKNLGKKSLDGLCSCGVNCYFGYHKTIYDYKFW